MVILYILGETMFFSELTPIRFMGIMSNPTESYLGRAGIDRCQLLTDQWWCLNIGELGMRLHCDPVRFFHLFF